MPISPLIRIVQDFDMKKTGGGALRSDEFRLGIG
jgi:hypothetical protein